MPILLLGYSCHRTGVTDRAIYDAGYGEFTYSPALDAPCRFGEAQSAFVAQGRGKPAATGYVCAPFLGSPRLYLVEPSERDRVDWH